VKPIKVTGAQSPYFFGINATGKLPIKKVFRCKGIFECLSSSKYSTNSGETAEMPGIYKENEFDLAGFSVGIVDRTKIINGK